MQDLTFSFILLTASVMHVHAKINSCQLMLNVSIARVIQSEEGDHAINGSLWRRMLSFHVYTLYIVIMVI